jgi:hypothetical protein
MRIESSVTSLSWIPSEAVTGLNKAVFGSGFTHYDDPPPDVIRDLEALRDADRFRFANHLVGWIEFDGQRITDAGYGGGCLMGATTVAVGGKQASFAAVAFDDIQRDIELTDTSAKFIQTVGGHTAVPAPRRVSKPPFVKFEAPTVWSTLSLTIHADGTSEFELLGASTFPRHWVYDASGKLAAKAGLADFKDWWRNAFGKHTPWGDEDSPTIATAVESELERELSASIMREGAKLERRSLDAGEALITQGEEGQDLFLILDGVVDVEVDGEEVAELGPGTLIGELALLEGGKRTASVFATTPVRAVVVPRDAVSESALEELAASRQRDQA